MNVKELRAELNVSLEEFARLLGLQSKSHAHAIEAENKCSVEMALKIEDLSSGRVPAASLNADVGRVEEARGIAQPATQDAERAA